MTFNISIVAGNSAANSSVTATGTDTHPITGAECTALNITTGQVLALLATPCWGAQPDDYRIGYSDPTPWGNLFNDYGTPPCVVTVSVLSASVVGIETQNQQFIGNTFTNSTQKPVTFTASATAQVENTTSTTWSASSTFETTQSISYGVNLFGAGISGETSFSWASTMSQGASTTNAVSLGTGMSALITVDPGETAQAFFEVSQGTLTVQIEYQAVVSGNVWMNYPDTAIIPAFPQWGSAHYFNASIPYLLTSNQLPTSATFTQTIQVGFYFDGSLVVRDSNEKLLERKIWEPGGIVPSEAAEAVAA